MKPTARWACEGRGLNHKPHVHTHKGIFFLPLQTSWDEIDTSRRLSDRAWDVARCKEALETCALKVDQEMEALTLVKPLR